MKNVVVVKLAVHDSKEKQKAMQAVSGLSGIESFELDMNDQKLTIIGDIDPVDVVAKLRKHWCTEIVSFGPPPEKKKEESKNDEPKKEDAKKDEHDEKKKTEAEEIGGLIIATNNYCPCHPCIQPCYYSVPQPEYHYYYVPRPENPSTCVIS